MREIKKLKFRNDLFEHMRSMNPDIMILMNTQSDIFYAYSPTTRSFYSGRLYDRALPSTSNLEESINSQMFDYNAEKLRLKIISRSEVDIDYHDSRHEGFSYFKALCNLTDITISKNDVVVGRSNFAYPKPKRYLRRVIENSIINDLKGGEIGVSTISIRLEHTFVGGTYFSTLSYSYADTPRRSAEQNSKHLSDICNMFADFMDAIEIELIDPDDFMIEHSSINENDVDDTILNLPPNRHPNPSQKLAKLLSESDFPGDWRT